MNQNCNNLREWIDAVARMRLVESVEPAFEHDCARCVFVGADQPQQGEPRVNQIDMYVHRTPSHVTLIRRYGSDPANYESHEWSPDRVSPRFQRVADAAGMS